MNSVICFFEEKCFYGSLEFVNTFNESQIILNIVPQFRANVGKSPITILEVRMGSQVSKILDRGSGDVN